MLCDDVPQALGEGGLRGDQRLVDELRGVVTRGQEEVVAGPVGARPPEDLEVDLLADAGIGRGDARGGPRCLRRARRAAGSTLSALPQRRGRPPGGRRGSTAPRDGDGVPGSPAPRGMRGTPRARPSGGSPPGGGAGHSARTRGCCRTGPLRSGAAASPRRFVAMGRDYRGSRGPGCQPGRGVARPFLDAPSQGSLDWPVRLLAVETSTLTGAVALLEAGARGRRVPGERRGHPRGAADGGDRRRAAGRPVAAGRRRGVRGRAWGPGRSPGSGSG